MHGSRRTEPAAPSEEALHAERERRSVAVRGIVQGVGFRPFTWSLARRLGLGGVVRNIADSVWIEIEGLPPALARFVEALREEAPALARIDSIECAAQEVREERDFRIETSAPADAPVSFVTPDAATCDACVRELFDEADRRHRHAFSSCTACGPRLTIVCAVPYDRASTTMAPFEMCAACRAEYHDPADRRFHAQPIACPSCGPRLSWIGGGEEVPDLVTRAARELARGAIVAIKGLGGYHLACDARSEAAVAELRRRKRRDAKPFAVMVRDVQAARQIAAVSVEEASLLESRARPIVLLRRLLASTSSVAPSVSPELDRVGVMLPYTPIHHLLVHAAPFPLVMTSGNVSQEPIAYEDDDARRRLGPLCDAMLVHDRPIHLRCDDSVAHVVDGHPAVLRRSRGYAPAPLRLPSPLLRPTLALGGHLKAVFALGVGDRATASHHLGDLDDVEALRSFRAAIAHFEALFRVTPERIVHDLHPDYATTAIARELEDLGRERLAVQHHEAHVASGLAEHGLAGEAIGVAFDGAGWGRDGAIWGGEIFVGTCGRLRRAAHLRYVGLPGGDRAAVEPWRMAVAHLLDAGVEPISPGGVSPAEMRVVRTMLERGVLTARTSSVGRLFDAVAALVGLRSRVAHEAQAAMELQTLAERELGDEPPPYPFAVTERDEILELDPRQTLRAIVEDVQGGVARGSIALRFHVTLAAMTTAACDTIRRSREVTDVVLTGGVFANALLARATTSSLRGAGFRAHLNQSVPTNDGGLAFGQLAAVAAADRG
jgi:hydrogenase maturation protein HypF